MTPLLEVCVDSLASARAAIAGGADRLELCSALAVGGLSPYAELLRQIRAEAPSIPVRCLMRPRPGDFLYEPEEIELLCAQMPALRRAGADGFVIGALTPDGELDQPAVRKMMAAAGAGAAILSAEDVRNMEQIRIFHLKPPLYRENILVRRQGAEQADAIQTLEDLLMSQAETV